RTGRRQHRLEGHTQPVISALSFSGDGKRLVSASQAMDAAGKRIADDVKVWDMATGEQLALFGNLDKRVKEVALSPDGARVAARLVALAKLNGAEEGNEI